MSSRIRASLPASFFLGFCGLLALPLAAQEVIHTFDNTTSGAVPRNSLGLNVNGATAANCNAGNPNALVRTFTVSDAFTVSDVAVGFNASHRTRDELAVVLESPAGTLVSILNDGATNGQGDSDDNYDVMLVGGVGAFMRDGDEDDVGPPYYHREVTDPTDDNLDDFVGEGSAGTWTLYVCDENNDGQTGTFNRARLVLVEAASLPSVCDSTLEYEWEDNGDDQPFTSVTVGDVTLAEDSTQDLFGNAVDTYDFVTRTDTLGAETGFYALGFDADPGDNPDDGNADESGGMIVTFSFDPPVRDLDLASLDVDTGSWEDLVRLVALDEDGARLPVQAASVVASGNDRVGDIFEGDANVGTNSTEGNVAYFVAGPVAELTFEYMTGDTPDSPNGQITGLTDPSFCAYDFGDAPDSYDTSLGTGAARHVLSSRDLHLGAAAPDGEGDGQPVTAGSDANGTNGDGADEDGVASFPAVALAPGDTYTVPVTVTNGTGAPATLCGWIDFDLDGGAGDGTFESDEGACVTVPAAGSNASCTASGGDTFSCQVSFTVPGDFVYVDDQPTYARFRVASSGLATGTPAGRVENGEVEDYRIAAGNLPVTLGWLRSDAHGLVEWQTVTEAANAGFRLVGVTADGRHRELALVPSRAVDSHRPLAYSARVDLAGFDHFLLDDVDTRGQRRTHGPFEAGLEYGALSAHRPVDWAAVKAAHGLDDSGDGPRLVAGLAPVVSTDGAHKAGAVTTARLAVSEAGIQVVTHEDLLAAGVDLTGVEASRIALVDRGRPLGRHVSGGDLFGPGSAVEFLLPTPAITLESPVDLVELVVDAGRAVEPLPAPPVAGGRPVVTRERRSFAPDNAYSFAAPTGDPWFDQQIVARDPVTVRRPFDLPGLASGRVELTVDLWGGSDFPGVDHHVRLRLGGELLADARFDGGVVWQETVDVTHLVGSTGNVLEIEVPNDTGNPFDVVVLEGFSVTYPRTSEAVDGRWSGRVRRSTFRVEDLPAGPAVAWSQVGRRWFRAAGTGPRLDLPSSDRAVWVAAESARLRPRVIAGVPEPARPSTADLLVVTHPLFVDHLDDLVALQESRGYEVDVVTTDAVWAAGSDHAPDAEALRRVLAASTARYVVLVGDASYDPHDHLGIGSISFVPTAYRRVGDIVAFAPSDAALTDGDGDGLPDKAIGRLPVKTPEELEALVAKLWSWQTAGHHGSALLVAGRSDAERAFADQNDAYAAALAGWDVEVAAVDDAGKDAVRQTILEAFGASPRALVSFVGHSSFGRWDFDPLLTWQDDDLLQNVGRPSLVTQWGCWMSYFPAPDIETISDHLLAAPDAGAATTIGAATLTSAESHERLGELFFEEVAAGAPTVGDAFLRAKHRLAAEGSYRDAIDGMVLLGDPAMPIVP